MEENVKHYVVGLAFSKTGNQMAAILKDRPEFQKGKWNGIGGKIEPGDMNGKQLFNGGITNPDNHIVLNAMVREFEEETGVKSYLNEWRYFAKVTILEDKLGGRAVIHCLCRFDNDVFECMTMETEPVVVHTVQDLTTKLPTAPNIPMLISIATNQNVKFVEITIENER